LARTSIFGHLRETHDCMRRSSLQPPRFVETLSSRWDAKRNSFAPSLWLVWVPPLSCLLNCCKPVSGGLGHTKFIHPYPFGFCSFNVLASSLFSQDHSLISLLTSLTCHVCFYCLRATTPRLDHFLCNLDFSAKTRSPKGRKTRAQGAYHTHFIYHVQSSQKMRHLQSVALAALGMWLILLDNYHVCWC